ncbi:hypothetical protein C0992_002250 [Termitomyces sp. T32_za158]|nr:hypothetical protein C0992_002250 [Termitomyces sp. T32_za158]
MAQKRKPDQDTSDCRKRPKLITTSEDQPAQHTSSDVERPATTEISTDTGPSRLDSRPQKKRRINKLVPPRPFPTVPTSVSATGPRSAHKEGKNLICVTRKTALGAYLRRCKDVIIKDGYKTLHFSAMGAAIPHLLQLVVALPSILPFADDEITTDVTTGTVELQDEVIPDDDDEDLTYETRGKSSLNVVLKIGDGEFEGDKSGAVKKNGKHRVGTTGGQGIKTPKNRDQRREPRAADIVLQEPEQEEMEMI